MLGFLLEGGRMSIKLIALDLDDTLLDSGLRVAPECIAAIQAARARGVRVTISTGRMYQSALPYARQLEIDVPLITYQGAWVKNSLTEEILFYKPLEYEMSKQIMEFFREFGVHYHSYYNDELCMEQFTEEGNYYSRLAGVKPLIVGDLIAELDRNEAMKIMAITDNQKVLLEMESELKSRLGQSLYITRSKPYFLEVMSRHASKANALQVIASHYGIDRKEIMAVGDSFNDIDMIEWAGLGVAMGNAFGPVKEAADFVTTSNDEAGVAEAIRRFIL